MPPATLAETVRATFRERLAAEPEAPALDQRGYIVDPATGEVPTQAEGIRSAARRQFPETVPAEAVAAALDLVGGGAGGELAWNGSRPPKFLAAHSSSALAAVTFGRWLRAPAGLVLAGRAGFTEIALERKLPIEGVGGQPPNLDALAIAPDHVVAVEAKCTEHLTAKGAVGKRGFAAIAAAKARAGKPEPYRTALDALAADGSWIEQYEVLRADPLRYRHFGATQVVKHYLGLKTVAGTTPATLLYAFWQPASWVECEELRRHRAEVEAFAGAVRDPSVRFHAMSYDALWATCEAMDPSAAAHCAALRRRYAVTVPPQPSGSATTA